jgi:excinuclease ABC subunit C
MSSVPKSELAPEAEIVEEDDEQSLPPPEEQAAKLRFDEDEGSLAAGRAAILHYAKVAPSRPGVYRMLDGRGDVLYVGKAKNVKKRIAAYARPTGLDTRIERMIAATRTVEYVVTRTETEALLLEANLIKRLRPRFNVVLRDDKSFPYILITSDHWAPQILKHRGARTRPGH